MRVTVAIGVSVLVAGCASGGGGGGEPTRAQPSAHPAQSTAPTTSTPAGVPTAGAPIAQVIAWIEAGAPVDAAGFHTATRAGTSTDLGDAVAFTGPADPPTSCTTATGSRGLTCLVKLVDPPPRPPDTYVHWQGGWVDFDGTSVQVGSAHGDAGPFVNGDGAVLPENRSLAFGDYRCRAQADDLFCVNYAHRSAARLGPAGIEAFGCLHPAPAPAGIGRMFSC